MTEREAELEALLRQRDEKIAQLEATVQALIKRIFGTKSEKIDPAQLELLLGRESRRPPTARTNWRRPTTQTQLSPAESANAALRAGRRTLSPSSRRS